MAMHSIRTNNSHPKASSNGLTKEVCKRLRGDPVGALRACPAGVKPAQRGVAQNRGTAHQLNQHRVSHHSNELIVVQDDVRPACKAPGESW